MGGRTDVREGHDGVERIRRRDGFGEVSVDLLLYKIDETQKVVDKTAEKVDGLIIGHTTMKVEMEAKAKAEGKISGAIWGFISAAVITVLSVILENVLGK